jgi:hypothetical protein
MRSLSAFALSLSLGTALLAQGPTCSTSLLGLGCAGQLDITFTPVGGAGNHRIDVAVSGLQADAWGVMVWGITPTNIPLGPGCSLLTEFAWGHVIKTDEFGEWSWSRSWPASVIGYYYIQIGTLVPDSTGLNIRVSDCKRAECQ